jgi:hypothetical protein
VFVFLLIGEGVIRLEQTGIFFASTTVERVHADFLSDHELDMLARARGSTGSPGDVRIMVLGDSKLRGLGVAPREVASVQLQKILERDCDGGTGRIHVLNLSRAGNNTLQNKLTFLRYYQQFQPHIVILGYNIDDVYGDNDEPGSTHRVAATIQKSVTAVQARRTPADVARSAVSSVRRLLFHSQALQFSLAKANMELKLAGVVIPGTEFYHLVHDSHRADYRGWVESRQHLQEITDICRRAHVTLLVYLVPQLEMLPHFGVFKEVDGVVEQFFRSRGVRIIDGVTPFLNSNPADYAISRYDGHPNAKAHALIAKQWADELEPLVGAVRRHASADRIDLPATVSAQPVSWRQTGGCSGIRPAP